MTHAKHVRIYRHVRFVEPNSLHHVGRFAPNARQCRQFGRRAGHFALEIVYQFARHSHQMVGLGVRIAHRLNVLEHLFHLGFGHFFGRGKTCKQGRRNLIDALIGALRAEQRGHQQLKGRAEFKFSGYNWGLRTKVIQYVFVSFVSCHR